MAKSSAREVALDILLHWEEKESYSNLLLNQSLQQSGLEPRDRGLVTELVYGCIQHLNTLDWILNRLVKKGVHSLEPWVRQVLRLGVYQLTYLDKIPERAAVHEMVELSKKRGHTGISSLVNGVLRSYLRQKESLQPPTQPETLKEKAIAYSYPEWMVKRMEQVYGAETTQASCLASLVPPKVSIRVNRLKMERDALIRKWNEEYEGTAMASSVSPDGVIIERGGNPAFTPLFAAGFFTIQDESSMLVAQALSPEPRMKVLDACAAPGGKTTHLATLMKDEGSVTACDIYPHKIDLIRSNVKRLGLHSVQMQQSDARELSSHYALETFDAILLDAPCSGLGVIHRKPDIKWSKEAEKIEPLVQLQHQLLEAVAPLLKSGGTLVYSTCTWEPRENQEQVAAFLERHPEFEVDAELEQFLPSSVWETCLRGEGWVQILPHHFHSDGFFISRMRKR